MLRSDQAFYDSLHREGKTNSDANQFMLRSLISNDQVIKVAIGVS